MHIRETALAVSLLQSWANSGMYVCVYAAMIKVQYNGSFATDMSIQSIHKHIPGQLAEVGTREYGGGGELVGLHERLQTFKLAPLCGLEALAGRDIEARGCEGRAGSKGKAVGMKAL